mmetsp:Transcript_36111/g.94898  ORF Transcript_36111/g.94898 Transcript_36111/m.94898 type:complete len:164 (-) Transcript_36111:309-800(-)
MPLLPPSQWPRAASIHVEAALSAPQSAATAEAIALQLGARDLLRASGHVHEGQLLDLSADAELRQVRREWRQPASGPRFALPCRRPALQLQRPDAFTCAPQHLRHVRVCDVSNGVADGASASTSIHVHHLYDEEAAEERRPRRRLVAVKVGLTPEADGQACAC